MSEELARVRHWYAQDLRLRASVSRNPAIIEAFAAVPRERFLPPGPWLTFPESRPDEGLTTPDAETHWVYHDILVALDPARQLNNGLPSFWARNFDHLFLARASRVLQVGAGTGYYTAVLAEIVGPQGRVTAVEHDGDLAARARVNVAPWPNVEVVHGDGRTYDAGEVDVIVVFAGSTHPAPLWLDRLAPGGRLLMPLTAENRWGILLRATRPADEALRHASDTAARRDAPFEATSIGWVGIFPCAGGRDQEAARRLQARLEQCRRAAWPPRVAIEWLHRGEAGPEASARVWYQGPGFWLESGPRVEDG
jgi:protein-L-isoaspartate(D-aspartate) O-methyltransferase